MTGPSPPAPASRDNLLDRWCDRLAHGLPPMQDDMLGAMVRASPIFAAHLLLRGPEVAPFEGRFLYGDVHLEWDRILTRERRFALLAPRGIGKSTVFAFAFPIWKMLCRPEQSGLLLGSTAENASRMLEEIRRELEENPLLRFLLPQGRQRDWNSRRVTCGNGHTLRARSVLSRLRGLHPDYIAGDDILSDEAKYSESYRRKTRDYHFSVIDPMLMPHGQLLIEGTPMHRNDLYHELADNSGYAFFSFPLVRRDGGSLWPELFPLPYIEQRKKILGSIQFTCEMMCEPVSDETSLLPRSLFVGEPQQQMAFRLGMEREALAPLGLKYYMGVDLAFSAASGADFFCIVVLGVDGEGNRWLVDFDRARGLSYLEQPQRINAMGRKYPCQRIYVEANAAQRIIGDDLIRRTDLPIKKWTTTAKKHDLAHGIPALRLLAENRKWRFPRGDRRSVEVTDLIYDEMGAFTFQNGKVMSLAPHDDTTLALYIADQAARVGAGFHSGVGASGRPRSPPPGAAGLQVAPAVPIAPRWRR